jgi:hypothetical protein
MGGFVLLALATLGYAAEANPRSRTQAPAKVQVRMRNIYYHFTDRITVDIRTLSGEISPTQRGGLVVFDDPNSFKVELGYTEIGIALDALSHTLNDYVFLASDAPLKEISIAAQDGMLKIKGKLHSKGNVGFETDGVLSATPGGTVKIETKKVKAGALPVKGLMDLLGIRIADLVNTRKVAGVQSQGNDLILDPAQVLPPPHIQGGVTQVRVEGNEVVLVFGKRPQGESEGKLAGNYMAYRYGRLRFGKLTMSDTDMILIDMDPNDPFDFFLDHYKQQLAAGYTKITPEFGLRVNMKDYGKLGK